MLTQDYLSLRLVRLKSAEEWIHAGPGLCLIFPRAGSGKFTCGTATGQIASGDVLVLDGNAGGKLRAPVRSELVFWHFSMRIEHLFPLFASDEICVLRGVLDRFKTGICYPASTATALECHHLLANVAPQFSLAHRGQLLRVAATVLSAEFKGEPTQRVGFIRVEEHMSQVFEGLSAADLLSLPVSELANRFGCSRRHLNRLFHHQFGVSVATLRMEMRLSKAVSLLRDPGSKVINVAEECGFNHLGLFNTCFKRRFGVSPGQWRKKTSSKPAEGSVLGEPNSSCPMVVHGLCPWNFKNNGREVRASVSTGSAKSAAARNGASTQRASVYQPNQFRRSLEP